MKEIKIIVFLILFLPSCYQKDKNIDVGLKGYIGNIKISKPNDMSNAFYIFVSSMIINYSNNEYMINDEKVVAKGILDNDTILFNVYNLRKIKPYDTVIWELRSEFHLPDIADSCLFIDNVKCLDIYALINSITKNDSKVNDTCLLFERTDLSKFVKLKNNVSYGVDHDSPFLFGFFEFYSEFIDTTKWIFPESSKFLVTGEYLKDLCSK